MSVKRYFISEYFGDGSRLNDYLSLNCKESQNAVPPGNSACGSRMSAIKIAKEL